MEFLNSITAYLNGESFKQLLAIFGTLGGLDLLLRLAKTEKPLSLLIVFSGFLKAAIKLALAVDAALDKVLPQRVKAPAVTENSDGK
jgi:hypothetical protein